jgi:hypothetical protein
VSAKRRRVICDGCGRIGGSYGPSASASALAGLRRSLAREGGWVRHRDTGGAHHLPGKRLDLCPNCQPGGLYAKAREVGAW